MLRGCMGGRMQVVRMVRWRQGSTNIVKTGFSVLREKSRAVSSQVDNENVQIIRKGHKECEWRPYQFVTGHVWWSNAVQPSSINTGPNGQKRTTVTVSHLKRKNTIKQYIKHFAYLIWCCLCSILTCWLHTGMHWKSLWIKTSAKCECTVGAWWI